MTMLAGPALLDAHVPKCAGSYRGEYLRRFGLADWDSVKGLCKRDHHSHQGLRVIPAEERASRLCTTGVRDPWSWHVSAWLQFGRSKYMPAETWEDALEWMLAPPKEPMDLPIPPYFGIVDRPFYAWVLDTVLCDDDGYLLADVLLDTGRITEGLLELLQHMGELTDDRLIALLGSEKVNMGKWGDDVSKWYTPVQAAMVGAVAHPMLRPFGYMFGGTARVAMWVR